jgi:hypothetical protein
MYAFLFALGAVIAAAGLALVASGVSIQEHAFDLASVTPGAIAIIGGCILIGLAFVVRALLRVEQALISRPMPRPARPGEAVAAPAAQSSEPARIPFPPKSKTLPQPQPVPVPAPARAATAEETLLGAPSAERMENAPIIEESDVSLLPKAPVRSDEEISEPLNGAKPNGAAYAKAATPVAVSGRPMRRPQQPKGSLFDSLWPKPQQQAAEVQAAPAGQTAPPPQPQESSELSVPSQPVAAPAPSAAMTIIKSGVVEGMAYTLYSDGSIEAQLPGGTLRFGSITELRNHIEHNG